MSMFIEFKPHYFFPVSRITGIRVCLDYNQKDCEAMIEVETDILSSVHLEGDAFTKKNVSHYRIFHHYYKTKAEAALVMAKFQAMCE